MGFRYYHNPYIREHAFVASNAFHIADFLTSWRAWLFNHTDDGLDLRKQKAVTFGSITELRKSLSQHLFGDRAAQRQVDSRQFTQRLKYLIDHGQLPWMQYDTFADAAGHHTEWVVQNPNPASK
jgi:hypothetical protein